jgi:hypothetical protein
MAVNTVQMIVDEFARRAGFTKKAGTWYRRSLETILVLELQRSQYKSSHYLNIGVWLNSVSASEFPKERLCHIRTRATKLVEDQEPRLSNLLDLDYGIPDPDRTLQLTQVLQCDILPVLNESSTLDGLRLGLGRELLNKALVTGAAQRILENRSG